MRRNPKLLMQMIPDTQEEEEKEDKLKGKMNKIQ